MKRIVCLLLIVACCMVFGGCAAPAVDEAAIYSSGYQAGYDDGYSAAQSDGDSVAASANAATSTPTPAPDENITGTRKNPAKIGDTVTVSTRRSTLEVTLLEVVRGEEAVSMAKNANKYNEYDGDIDLIMAKFKVKNIKDLTGEDDYYSVSTASFHYADASFATSFPNATVAGIDDLRAKLYEGSEAEGYIFMEGRPGQDHDFYVFENAAWFDVSASE